jgi:N-acylneuraminate cytidylyltransferase/CMP-N,N'-diacetyllegionaminic acid synthase
MIAFIPARSGSTRLKNKNIKMINGKPLIGHTIEQARKAKKVTQIIVSTDCENIARISKKFGAEVPFLRPKKLSDKKTSLFDVCKHMMKKMEQIYDNKIESFIVLQPTSPMRSYKDIDNSINFFNKKKKAIFLASVVKSKPVEWYISLKKKNFFFNKMILNKFQNMKYSNELVLNGAIFIYSKKYLTDKALSKNNFYYYEMPQNRSIDIDTKYDFLIAKNLMEKNNV